MRYEPILHTKFDTIQVQKGSKSGEEDHDRDNNRLYAKLLVSNAGSGSIIGKMGVNIHRTQMTTGAKIQLSKPSQLFPGTNDRTLLIRGNLCQLASAMYSIFIRLIEEGCAPTWSPSVEEDDVEGSGGERPGREGLTGQTGRGSAASSASTGISSAASLEKHAVLTPGRQSEEGLEGQQSAGTVESSSGDDRGVDIGADNVVEKDSTGDMQVEKESGNDKDVESDGAEAKDGRSNEDHKTDMDISEHVAKAPLQVKLVIPEEFIGYIVGRSGANVTNICATTHTSIKVFPQPMAFSLTHQIVGIRGHLVDIIKAISMIVIKQADDQEYYGYANIPHSYVTRTSYGLPMMPMYHPHPGVVGYLGADVLPHGNHSQDVYARMAGPSQPGHATNVPPPSPAGGQFVSMMVPLAPEQQSELLKNLGAITQTIQLSTGVLLKLESVPGHGGFCVRLDGPREHVMMAINILLSQLAYPAAVADPHAQVAPHVLPALNMPMSPPMSPPVSRDTPSPFDEQVSRWQHIQSPE